ncbi:NIPSNAP family protein [Bosea sp. (in: a-proteobacteria)]|uniref:NIPSNAP family protein n=1 Tax=Bosea sp. (in: a-proteobacteria) TaxID=1871050 RepID=UPI002FC8CBC7
MSYAVTTITPEIGGLPKVLEGVKAAVTGDGFAGTLLGCFTAEIGGLNQVLILQAYDDDRALAEDRARQVLDGNPFGAAEHYREIRSSTYASFDFVPPITPGKHGPVYEFRIYGLKAAGLKPTIELWRQAVPERAKVSPLLGCMYAIDGDLPRFLHIWPYASLDDRMAKRTRSVEIGIWPPKGGPAHLASMSSGIYLPTAFSPLS